MNETLQLRCPVNGNKRHPKTVSPHELGSGIMDVLMTNREGEKRDVYREVCRQLGLASLSKEAEAIFEESVKYLEGKGLVLSDSSLIRLSS